MGNKWVGSAAENIQGCSGSQAMKYHVQKKKKKEENFIPGYIIRSVVCKTREVIILLYLLPVRA